MAKMNKGTQGSKTTQKKASLPTFKPDVYYRVNLVRSATYAGRELPAGAHIVMKGKVAQQVKDAIGDASEIAT
jgi:hypothetical protein